jgi:hypothetical protein
MGFKKGWRAFKAAKRKRSKPRRTGAGPKRRGNPKPKGGNPVARKKKVFNVNLLDLGGGIVLADQFLGPGAIDSIVALKMPNLKGLPARLRDPAVQGALVKTGVSIAILKTAFRGFARQVGAIGPLKMKI